MFDDVIHLLRQRLRGVAVQRVFGSKLLPSMHAGSAGAGSVGDGGSRPSSPPAGPGDLAAAAAECEGVSELEMSALEGGQPPPADLAAVAADDAASPRHRPAAGSGSGVSPFEAAAGSFGSQGGLSGVGGLEAGAVQGEEYDEVSMLGIIAEQMPAGAGATTGRRKDPFYPDESLDVK